MPKLQAVHQANEEMSQRYPHGCDHDVEQERIAQAEEERCLAGECEGAPRCAICLDAQERGEESLGG